MGTKIPAIYIGIGPLRLSADHGSFLDGDGKPLKTMDVLPGQTLMMPAQEVNGMTIWHDPHQVLPSQLLGIGRVVKQEHAGLDMETLQALGYEFHDGRSDFISVEEANRQAAKKAAQVASSPEKPVDAPPQVASEAPAPVPITVIPLPPQEPPQETTEAPAEVEASPASESGENEVRE